MGHEFKWTLNTRFMFVTVFISIPIILVLTWMNNNNVDTLRQQKLSESEAEVVAEMSQIDTLMELLEISLINLTANDPDFRLVATNQARDLDFWRANQRSMLKIRNLSDAATFDYTVFAYYPENDIFVNEMTQPELLHQVKVILDEHTGELLPNEWNILWDGEKSYGVRIIAYEDYYVGIYLTFDSLLKKLGVTSTELVRYDFYDQDGVLLANGSEGTVMPISDEKVMLNQEIWYGAWAKSQRADYGLIKVISVSALNDQLPRVTSNILFAAVILVVVLSVFIVGLFFWVVSPMNNMKESMARIVAGELTYRIPRQYLSSQEFEDVRLQFNAMMDQLEALKIEIYEGKLERQETKLQYLSQQIQPHFILNSLNTLYNYVEHDPKVTKDMILLLSKFYRYVVNINSKYVSLGEELAHIENYLLLQKVRFPKSFKFLIECDSAYDIIPVPPFLIESFVVNAMKYGLVYDRLSVIRVQVEQINDFEICIRIEDDGEGFSEDVLESITEYKENRHVTEELGVGLRNAIERLKLIYDDRASILFYNKQPYGAVVEIQLTLQNKKEQDDEH